MHSLKPKLKSKKEEEKILNEAKQHVEDDGFDHKIALYSKLQRKFEALDNLELHFALYGSNKLGKSSFINAIFGDEIDLESLAKVSLVRPNNRKIKFRNIRSKAFSKKPRLDAFLIFVKSRITEKEKTTVKKISEKHGMPFVFILTHSDESKDNEASLLDQLKRDIEGLVKDEADIYEINKRDTANHKIKGLCEDIISKLENNSFLNKEYEKEFKKNSFLHSLNKAIYVNNKKTKKFFKQAKKQGVPHIHGLYNSHLIASWMNTEINLAITGDSGTGKSSFINAVRGIKAYEKGAAAVDVAETTKKATRYSHPKHKNIIFWDLPGIGTPKYPNYKEYCKKVGGLEKYDAFLIFCKTRFTHYDKELAEKISKVVEKPFFFVHTNVDTELKNAKDDEGPKFNEATVMKRMRENCMKNLEVLMHDEKDIFLIDNKVTEKYDFQRLKESIAEALPEEKQESFVASLDKSTHTTIRIKANFLRAHVQLVIVLFVIAESNPKDFVELISLEVIRYHRVFGLYDQLKKSLMTSEEIDELCHKEEHEKKIRRKIDEKIQKKKSEEIKEELMKDKSVEESPAKVNWAYDYLLNCIKSLEKEALKPYDAANKQGENSQT
ncbi:uncharacterized protein LOC124437838 [Xenia sp. Carnegie-2017]|uniref:uncharacterized protein LOC124437838 n=1 Tax=Xenia sp. Carnegie-2017 TaxID=2897299 RepID=UPI001F03A6EE|nr:uncharacterized protein LOC124437838 [Xenia sp. Carnegie-2017]